MSPVPSISCGNLDTRRISEDDLLSYGVNAWVRADFDEKLILFQIPPDLYSIRVGFNNGFPTIFPQQGSLLPRPHIVLKLSSPAVATLCPNDLVAPRGLVWAVTGLIQSLQNNRGQTANPPPAKNTPTVGATGINIVASGYNSLDISSLNDLGFYPAAVVPTAAVVPMRSNIRIYGPWGSSNFFANPGQCGGTQVEQNPDLAPWVWGSTVGLNVVALNLVEQNNVGLVKAESGGATFPGLPTVNQLGNVAGGPTLTGINFNFGAGGITTNYEYRTYTPKFGKLPKLYADRLKLFAKRRTEQLRFIKSQANSMSKFNRKLRLNTIRDVLSNARFNFIPDARKASLQRVITAEIYDYYISPPTPSGSGYSQRTVVGMETLSKSTNEMMDSYNKKAFMSLDGIFGPVSLSGDGGLPRFATADRSHPSGQFFHFSSPIQPHPPFTLGSNDTATASVLHDEYNLNIYNMYLNPLTNPSGNPHYINSCPGHVIDMVGRNSTVPDSGLISNLYDYEQFDGRYSTDYRFLGLRGPIVVHAWGYDLDGKPVPNAIDKEHLAKSGIFVTEVSGVGLKDAFMDNWLEKPASWPVGPIDLRWDRNRGMWVTPQPYKLVVARVTKNVPAYGKGLGAIINKDSTEYYGQKIYDSNGVLVAEESTAGSNETNLPIIILVDRIGNSHSVGDMVYAHYDAYNSEYIILSGGTGTPIKIGKFCNQWPSLSNVKDPTNAVKKVALYQPAASCDAYGAGLESCPWAFEPMTETVNGVEVPVVVDAVNLFANVAAHEYQTKWCALFQAGTTYVLLAAEC